MNRRHSALSRVAYYGMLPPSYNSSIMMLTDGVFYVNLSDTSGMTQLLNGSGNRPGDGDGALKASAFDVRTW